MDWASFTPPLLAAFLASLVECIEALTVVLAVGAVLGWAGALSGTALALLLLLAAVAALGPAMTLIPLAAIHVGIGLLLLAFGARWLRKAVLRAAGAIPLRDEAAAYARQSRRFGLQRLGPRGNTGAGLLAAFHITLVEGVEVAFIVLAIGGANRRLLRPASLGALAGVFLVCVLGLALHRPIARIPQNPLKFAVGVLTCTFGCFWLGEGLGVRWPGQDWSPLVIACAILAGALAAVRLAQRRFTGAKHH